MEYIKQQNIIMTVLRLIKKNNNVKEDPKRKSDSNFDFFKAALCLWGFNKKKYYVVYIIELFLHQSG